MSRTHASLLLLIGLAMSACAADPQFPVVRWSGVIEDATKENAKPDSDIITDQKELAALWKAWREKEDPPLIDFKSHLVLVKTMANRKFSILQWSVDDKGALAYTSAVEGDKKGIKKIDGFGYGIAVIPRENIKSYKGKPLPEPK